MSNTTTTDARDAVHKVELTKAIEREVDRAPALTPERRAQLASLLAPYAA